MTTEHITLSGKRWRFVPCEQCAGSGRHHQKQKQMQRHHPSL